MFPSYSMILLVARCHPLAAELARAGRITNSKKGVTMPMLPELCDFVTSGCIEPSNHAGWVKSREFVIGQRRRSPLGRSRLEGLHHSAHSSWK
jgi:hypothetical protein